MRSFNQNLRQGWLVLETNKDPINQHVTINEKMIILLEKGIPIANYRHHINRLKQENFKVLDFIKPLKFLTGHISIEIKLI